MRPRPETWGTCPHGAGGLWAAPAPGWVWIPRERLPYEVYDAYMGDVGVVRETRAGYREALVPAWLWGLAVWSADGDWETRHALFERVRLDVEFRRALSALYDLAGGEVATRFALEAAKGWSVTGCTI